MSWYGVAWYSAARPAAACGSRPQTAVSSMPSVAASAGACVTRAQCPVPTRPNRSGGELLRRRPGRLNGGAGSGVPVGAGRGRLHRIANLRRPAPSRLVPGAPGLRYAYTHG